MTDKTRILFVDDEPNVLAALRRMLRAKRDEWEMVFVESGAAALAELETAPFDVIVSDIRMPSMDGADLLTKVRLKYPLIIRIALSGQVDLNEVIRSIRAVHQYISKPCEADYLVRKIEGALKSRDVLTDESMLNLVTSIDTLPVIPRVFRDIEAELGKDEPNIDRVAELITQDVGLVAKILKLVNSPYFGMSTNIDSVHKAITMLGLDTLKALVLSTHLFTMYDENKLPDFSLNMLWEHCFRVSNIARLIAECEGEDRGTITQCRTAGLLHDVGKLILTYYFPQQYTDVLQEVLTNGGPICRAERIIYGTTHAEIGAYLMGLWGVSGNVVHAIGHHHDYDQMDNSVAMYLAVANVIDHNCIVFNDNYERIKLNTDLAPLVQDEGVIQKWMVYLEEKWSDMDIFKPIDDDVLCNLLG